MRDIRRYYQTVVKGATWTASSLADFDFYFHPRDSAQVTAAGALGAPSGGVDARYGLPPYELELHRWVLESVRIARGNASTSVFQGVLAHVFTRGGEVYLRGASPGFAGGEGASPLGALLPESWGSSGFLRIQGFNYTNATISSLCVACIRRATAAELARECAELRGGDDI